ncbi:MAG: UDP-N-acetylglucosamine 1-carboxyvinyltransferase [candidate division KSB1 bacterium]|nr:UDP-N-acetylglucosamine 1-carboxyvinyltransferase [candidate division KSB1 bacterium]
MEKFEIRGGKSLNGVIKPQGNKNEALPAIAACLLTDKAVTLRNVPDILDVRIMLQIMKSLGARVDRLKPNSYRIQCDHLKSSEPDREQCGTLRAAILLAGSLLSRSRSVVLPPPGGDVIGRRRLDDHFLAFESLGVRVSEIKESFVLEHDGLKGADIFFEQQSVTATENALMAAVLAEGETVLSNAACEPHVKGLSQMLINMGADIQGLGTNILHIKGVESLSGTEHTIGSDLLEIGGYIVLAAITKSEITIQDTVPEEIRVIDSTYRKLGIRYLISEKELTVPADQHLMIKPDFAGDIPKIDDGTWPAFPTDLMSMVIVAATQSTGTALFFEKMYDGRMFFTDHLIGMGARIVLCDPHRVVVVGPSTLYGTTVHSPDIRAGMALVIAALCAKGKTSIYNIRQIDRGYEDLEGKLQSLGADIKRVV